MLGLLARAPTRCTERLRAGTEVENLKHRSRERANKCNLLPSACLQKIILFTQVFLSCSMSTGSWPNRLAASESQRRRQTYFMINLRNLRQCPAGDFSFLVQLCRGLQVRADGSDVGRAGPACTASRNA